MSYLEKIMLVCGDQPAVYKELEFQEMQSDEEERHLRAELDQHVSVIITHNRHGEIVGGTIRTTDPEVVQRVQSLVKEEQHDHD